MRFCFTRFMFYFVDYGVVLRCYGRYENFERSLLKGVRVVRVEFLGEGVGILFLSV